MTSKMMKKLLSLIILTCMLTAAFSGITLFEASAATKTGTTGDCTWSLNGTVLTISGNG